MSVFHISLIHAAFMQTQHLLWLDLEMTGLNENTDKIMEIGAIITNFALQPLAEFHRVIFQPDSVLDTMNDWCKKPHGSSGLTEACRQGTPLETAEAELIAWMKPFFKSEKAVLAGNSIHNDRRFIDHHMKPFAETLHYRMVDVSSYKVMFQGRNYPKFEKRNGHRAIDDINESIRELDYYLKALKV